MNKQKLFTALYVILIIGLLLFMAFVVHYMRSNGAECLKDPIQYMESKNEGSECYCIKIDESNPLGNFEFLKP